MKLILMKPCYCGQIKVEYIGVQMGLRSALALFNCVSCHTSRAFKVGL